jgi:PAS domain S-box-containing protein
MERERQGVIGAPPVLAAPAAYTWSARGEGAWEGWQGDGGLLGRVLPADREALAGLGPAVLARGAASVEVRLLDPERGERWFLARAWIAPGGEAEGRWVGVAVDVDEHKRAALAEAQRRREDQALLLLARELERAETHEAACQAAERAVTAATGYGMIWLYVFTPDLRHGDVYFAHDLARDPIASRLSLAGDPMLEEIVAADHVVVVEDARTDPRTDKAMVAHFQNRTIVNVPIALPGRRIGALGTGTYGDEGVRPPSPGEQRFLVAAASHLAVVLDRVEAVARRREAEARLRDSEEHYRQIVDHADVSVFLVEITGVDGYRMLEANPTFERTARVPREACLGQPVEAFFHGAHLTGFLERCREVMETGAPLRREVVYERPGGTATLDSTLVPVRDAEGRIYRIAVISRDITEARETERALRRLNRTLRTLSRGNEALVRAGSERELLDRMCRVLVAEGGQRLVWIGLRAGGDGALRVTSSAAQEGAERDLVGFLPALDGPVAVVDAAPLPAVVHDIEVAPSSAFRAAALARGYRSAAALPLRDGGASIGVLQLFSADPEAYDEREMALLVELADDLTYGIQALRQRRERELAEEALNALTGELEQRVADRTAELARVARAKDEFLASMSHELRTPLNGILGTAEVIAEGVYGPVDGEMRAALGRVEESGRHLLSLINDILDVAKVEAGKLALEPGPVAVEDLCRASLRLVQEPAQRKRIRLALGGQLDLPTIVADERRLKQVLVNLLTNAVKFTPAGGKVGVDVDTADDGATLCIAVWDTGVGIAAEDLPRLFQSFVQLDTRLAREQAGTGLGLALVRRLVGLHGGSVDVQSEPGRGSRFTVRLPAERAAAPAPAIAEGPPSLPRAPAGARLVLLAEDDPTNVTAVRDLLHARGHEVRVAGDGAEAVRLAREIRPDVILMDVQMPGVDGLTAMRTLRASGDTRAIPILAVTALAMPGDRERCLAAGADDYLSKPVSIKRLVTAIESIRPLPRAASPAAVSSPEPPPSSPALPAPRLPRVLVVDDLPMNIAIIRGLAQIGGGVSIDGAADGEEALERVRAAAYDLVIMDLEMPRLDGAEACRRLRAEGFRMPVVAMTAASPEDAARSAREAGMDGALAKPVRRVELQRVFDAHLGAARRG